MHPRPSVVLSCICAVSLVIAIGCAPPTPGVQGTGEDSLLTDGNVQLVIPTGALPNEITIQLAQDLADTSDIMSATPAEHPATMRFSSGRVLDSQTPLQIQLSLSPEFIESARTAGQGVYALIRETGSTGETEPSTQDQPYNAFEWRVAIGTLNREQATYTLPLFATAEQIDVAVVRGDDLVCFIGNLPDSAARLLGTRNAHNTSEEGWHERPWAVFCSRDDFTVAEQAAYRSILEPIQTNLNRATAFLAAQGWNKSRLNTVTAEQVYASAPHAVPLLSEQQAQGMTTLFNSALLVRAIPGQVSTSRGSYRNDSTPVYFTPLALDQTRQQANGDVFTHELFHAVQHAEAPIMFGGNGAFSDWLWLCEGMTQMMGYLALDPGNMEGLPERKFFGARRNWTTPFQDREDPYEMYRNFELFAQLNDCDITYLKTLLPALDRLGPEENSLLAMDNAVRASIGMGFIDAHMRRVLSQRCSPHPDNFGFAVELGSQPSRSVTNADLAGDPRLAAGTSVLLNVTSNRDASSCLRITLAPSAEADLRLLIVADNVTGAAESFFFRGITGYIAPAGTPVRVADQNPSVCVVRADLTHFDEQPWSVTFETEPGCGIDLTGTWCACSEFGLNMIPCVEYGSFLRLTQTGDTLSGFCRLWVCELAIPITEGMVSGNSVIIMANPTGEGGYAACTDHITQFDLQLVGEELVGTWETIGNTSQLETIRLRKYSDDPNVIIPAED